MGISLVLALIGLGLVYLEFYLPGGVMGSAGVITLIASIVSLASHSDSVVEVVLFTAALAAALVGLIRLALKRIRTAKSGYSVYLEGDQEGYRAPKFDEMVIGKQGKAACDLRPSGHILIEGKKHQAVSQSSYIEKDTEVTVLKGKGAYLVVKPTIKTYTEKETL